MKTLFRLFITFFKIGAFTFGGGYAMIPLIQRETVEKNAWVSEEDILDVVAIAESTPGPIAINSSTFVGYKVKGFWGAFFATFGMVLPSFLMIFFLSFILKQFYEVEAVKYAFFGIRVGVLALVLKALYSMWKSSPKGAFPYFIMLFSFVVVALLNLSVIVAIISSALFGLVYSLLLERRGK